MSDDLLDVELSDRPEEGNKKKRLRDRWLLLSVVGVLGLILIVAIAIAGWYGKSVLDALNSMDRDSSLMPDRDGRPPVVVAKKGTEHPPLNIVLMGTDARSADERGRSDVLMVFHLNGDRDEGYLISFPRDLWVDIPGHQIAKINAAYSWGGTALTIETLEQLLDVPMDHAAVTDFTGFSNVIDAVDGVTVHNETHFTAHNFDFPEGDVELDGQRALAFVRERKTLPKGDLSRAEHQRDVLEAVAAKMISKGVLASPRKFRDSVTALGSNLVVDQSLDNDTIIKLGRSLDLTSPNDIHAFQAPTDGFGTSSDKQSYLKVHEEQLAELAEAMKTDTVDEYVDKYES